MNAQQIIKDEISDCVERIEATPLWNIWREGRLSDHAYATILLQFHALYRSIEVSLMTADPYDLMRPELAYSEVLAGDLYVLRQLRVETPTLMKATRRAAERILPNWGETMPERLVAAAWTMETLRHRLLRVFGGTVESLHFLPGSNRGMNYIRTTLADTGMERHQANRHFCDCLSQACRPEQTAVGAVMYGEIIERIFRQVVADPTATHA